MTKTIRHLLKHIDSEELVPEIQRDFVWKRQNVLKLFDSLFRGMPIGNFLVWKARKPVGTRTFMGRKPPVGAGEIDSFYGYLLDGQQRLTALARVRDRDNEYPLRLNLRRVKIDPGGSRFAWQSRRNLEDPWFVSVADVLGGQLRQIQWIDEIRAREKVGPEDAEHLQEDLTKLQGILDYDAAVTEFESDDYREATELFIRFNATGKRLGKHDLVMAELALSVPGLASGEMAEVRAEWPEFPFTASFLVQCLLVVHTDRLRLKDAKTAWGEVDERAVRKSWSKLHHAMEDLVPFLTGTVHWSRLSMLPSINALIPLVYVRAKGTKWDQADRDMARRWLHLTTLHNEFSGAVATTIDGMIRKVSSSPSVKSLWAATSKSALRRLRTESFFTSRLDGPEMATFLASLSVGDARDWVTQHRLDGSVLGKKAALQIHHFFPRSLLRKHGHNDDSINTMANYTVISASTNLNVGTEEPATYMERLNVSAEQLRLQCIPEDRLLWHVLSYEKFCASREKLLTESMNRYLGF
jgi:hypothetical protein